MIAFSTRPASHTPIYRRQRKKFGADLAFVRLDGKRVYLGIYDAPESRARYHQLIAEWEISGRLLPSPPDQITVAEIAHQYMVYTKTYYVKNGRPTSEPENIVLALRPLLELHSRTPAIQFGPKSLKLVRQNMIERRWTRKYINKHVDRIKRMFKWAVAEELIHSSVYEALRALPGLRFGRSGALDKPPVLSAPVERVEITKQHLNRQVATMLELQLLTGARPGEVVIMRPMDIDRSGPVWIYKPGEHKTEHHGHDRLIFIGPQAQQILTSFLLRAPDAYCFSPAEAERERREAKRQSRVTPQSCGNNVGTNRKENPQRVAGNRYTTGSYRRAINRMIRKAFPLPDSLPRRFENETLAVWKSRMTDEQLQEYTRWRESCWWHPHQLRHNYATTVRAQYGLEAAQVLLGHSKADVTQIYAERDKNSATQVALKIG